MKATTCSSFHGNQWILIPLTVLLLWLTWRISKLSLFLKFYFNLLFQFVESGLYFNLVVLYFWNQP